MCKGARGRERQDGRLSREVQRREDDQSQCCWLLLGFASIRCVQMIVTDLQVVDHDYKKSMHSL